MDALPQDRLHLSDVQSDSGNDGAGERDAADDLRRTSDVRCAGESAGDPRTRGTGASVDEQAQRNVRRTAAARRERASVRKRPGDYYGRPADGTCGPSDAQTEHLVAA